MTKEAINKSAGWIRQVKRYLADGLDGYSSAAARILEAQKKDPKLTQKKVSASIGKSETWVSRLLKWYRAGCLEESIFEGQHSATRTASKAKVRKGPAGLDLEFDEGGKLLRDGEWRQERLPIFAKGAIESPPLVPKGNEQSGAARQFLEASADCRRVAQQLNRLSRQTMLAACRPHGKRARAQLEAFRQHAQSVEKAAARASEEAKAALTFVKHPPDFV